MYVVKPIVDLSGPLENFYPVTQSNNADHKPSISLETITAQVRKVVNGTDDNKSPVGSISARQAKVLRQLDDITRKLNTIQSSLAESASNAPVKKTTADGVAPYLEQQQLHMRKFNIAERKPVQATQLPELIINADPDTYIPYGLRVVQALWQDRVNVQFKTFTHSSIAALPESAQLFNRLIAHAVPSNDAKTPTLQVTLIWKRCAQLELICAAAQFQPIIGEANILRYLYRIGPAELNWPDSHFAELFVLDGALDTVHALSAARGGAEERATLWAQLLRQLNAAPRFGGDVLSAADVAVASAVRQFALLGRDKVPTQLLTIWKEVNALAESATQ